MKYSFDVTPLREALADAEKMMFVHDDGYYLAVWRKDQEKPTVLRPRNKAQHEFGGGDDYAENLPVKEVQAFLDKNPKFTRYEVSIGKKYMTTKLTHPK